MMGKMPVRGNSTFTGSVSFFCSSPCAVTPATTPRDAVARRLFHCSIRQCPEVGEYLRRFRRIHQALREEDADHALCRIGVCRCAEASGLTEPARGVEDLVAPDVHRHS
jgi:hypothetical protein